ncbi:MAG: type I glutamate--ammonia ligase [Clostridia bacterium]
MEKERIRKIVREKEIEFIRLQFVDIFGFAKNISITKDELDKAMDGSLMFDGSSVDGFARVQESDMYLVPDLGTFNIHSWRPGEEKTAHFFCDVHGPDGEPFEGCPRNILKKSLKAAKDMGYVLNVGPEGEFFLFHLDAKGNPSFDVHDTAGYFDLSPVDKGEDARRDILLTMKKMGFSIEASHHEVAPGQHEIDFKYDEALATADKWISFKQVVKNIAAQYGLYASFIAKPFSRENGNAMHCNQSLFRDDKNIFHNPGNGNGLSETAIHYIGGLIKHAKSMAAICNPTVNSYKRLIPGYEAPNSIGWSCGNRTSLIRIPTARGDGTRIELRTPDPTANAYLVFAVMLAAGLDGIRNKIQPPPEIEGDAWHFSPEKKEKYCIEQYPCNLHDALSHMEGDDLIRETLGDHAFNAFLSSKRKEWQSYESTIHDWEINEYLKKY